MFSSFLLPLLLASALATPPISSPTSRPYSVATAVATARVGQAQGKYVFCYTQPVAAYDVAFTYQATYTPSQSMTLNTIIAGELTSALTEAGAQLKAFDAILIQPGARDVAIKFRDDVPQDQRALATVPRQEGKELYLFCEPLATYDVVKTEGISWYNHAFGGAYYSFARVEENLLKTAKKSENVDAILFGETATYVRFKK